MSLSFGTGGGAASPLSRLRERVASECEPGEGSCGSTPLPLAFARDPLPASRGEGAKPQQGDGRESERACDDS